MNTTWWDIGLSVQKLQWDLRVQTDVSLGYARNYTVEFNTVAKLQQTYTVIQQSKPVQYTPVK